MMSRATTGRSAWRLVAIVAIVLLLCAGCAAPMASGGDGERAATPTGPAAEFRRVLDRHGIELDLPERGKAVLVNVPAFELVAFEDGAPVLRSRVIVGTPRNPSPLIDTHASAVRFRPTWRPTPDMIASGEYDDRLWPPGAGNPLGLAAIRLEPGLLVYLHDTNRRGLFSRERRALSHGCIRVERWDALIAWLLDVDRAQVLDWAEGRRTFDVPTPPVPVMIRYYLVFPDETGRLERFADIYRRGVPSPLPPDRRAGEDRPACGVP